MYSRPTAPKSIGGVLDDTFKLFGSAWSKCWLLSVTSSLALALPTVYLYIRNGRTALGLAGGQNASYWVLMLAAYFVYLTLHLAILQRIDAVARDTPLGIAETIGRGVRLSPRSFIATIVVLLPIILFGAAAGIWAAGWGIVGGGFAQNPQRVLLFFAALILVAIPYFAWALYRAFYNIVIITEETGPLDALRVSRTLVVGNWWRTAAILTVVFVIAYLLLLCGQFVVGMTVLAVTRDPILLILTTQVMSIVMAIFTAPWVASALLSTFYDLQMRRQGDDLAVRVAAVGAK